MKNNVICARASVLLLHVELQASDDTPMFCRNSVSGNAKTITFVPDNIFEEELARGTMKRGKLGMCFMDKFDTIKTAANGQIVFEVAVKTDPPSEVQPFKVKFWTTGKATLEPGKKYKVF